MEEVEQQVDDIGAVSINDQSSRVSVQVVMKMKEDQQQPAFDDDDDDDDRIISADAKEKRGLEKSPTSPIDEEVIRRLNFQQSVTSVTRSNSNDHDSFQRIEILEKREEGLVEGPNTITNGAVNNDPNKVLNSIAVNLFHVSSDPKESNEEDITEFEQVSSLAYMSDSTFAGSLLGDDSGDEVSKPTNGLDSGDGGVDEEKRQEEYGTGEYLPRQDVFLPSSNDNINFSPDKHQALLFGNLDRSFDNNIPSNFDGVTVCSTQELKDIIKMCFSAMAVVFSSHNPSVTTMAKIGDTKAPSDGALLGIQDVIVHNNEVQKGTATANQSLVDKSFRNKHLFLAKAPPSPTMSSLVSCMSDDNNYSLDSNDNESVVDTLLNENSPADAMVDNMNPVQRPSVPLVVVHMLWRQLIKYRLYDRARVSVEKEIESIIKIVQDSLANELGFLESISFTSTSRAGSSLKDIKEDTVESISSVKTSTVECLQISHDIHLQYGRYISKNCAKYFPFYLVKRLKKSVHFLRVYDEETWNPEEALNAMISKTCVKFFKKYSAKTSDEIEPSPSDLLKFEYSIEMLPWHLMRSMLYYDVVDLLTDYSFVHRRMEVLGLTSAVQMHIADIEELNNSINSFIALNPTTKIDLDIGRVVVQTYSLLGGIIHSENSINSRSGEGKVADEEAENEDNQSILGFQTTLSISKAMQALGDSLSRCSLKAEAMKFYYRALDKFECIHAEFSTNDDEDTKSADSISRSHSHLLMGGILSRIAFINEHQRNNSDAMLCYERALSFYSRHKTNQHCRGVAKVLASMGQLHLGMQEYDSAYSCLRESLSLWKTLGDNTTEEIANLLLLLGHVQKEKGKLNEALVLLSEAMYDKINVYGKSHPEVGFLHQTIGAVYCDKGDFHKGLSHFDNALRIRESALESVLKHFNYNETNERIQAREIEVAESLQCIGKVYEHFGDVGESFSFLIGNVAIYRSHLLAAVSNQASIMVSDVVTFLESVSGDSIKLSNLYRQLIQAIQVGKQLYSIDAESLIKSNDEDVEKTLEIESQMAEILYDLGLIEAAQFTYRIGKFGDDHINLNESLRQDAKNHFEQSIKIRKRMLERMKNLDCQDDDQNIDYENITVAVISYELGKLFCNQESNTEENDYRRRRTSLAMNRKQHDYNDYSTAVLYFEDAKNILEDSIEMAETLDYINNEDDCWISRLHKTPEIFEDMLHTLAVLYRKLEKYDESVECYNSVSFLLTRNELGDDKLKENVEENKLSLGKVKVADSSQSIGDIFFDTGEFSRALKSYEEALQLRLAQECDSLIVAETLCLKGNALLKLKRHENAIISFNEAFRIRIEKLPKDHKDIASCFHLIGNAYEGDGKLYQALEYYKKAQKILSKHVVDTDTNAADLFYDLGKVVLLQDASSKWLDSSKQPTQKEISLSFNCFELSRDIYRRNFGDDALELGNTLDSLGIIHLKYHEYDKAIPLFQTALKIFHGAPLVDQSLKIARTLNNLALVLIESGSENYDLIFDYLNLSKETYEEKYPCSCEDYAELMFNMGEASLKTDDIIDATKFYKKSSLVYETVFSTEHLSVSVALEKLGHCQIRNRQHDDALESLTRALDIRTNYGRQKDLNGAEIYFNLGITHCETGQLNTAIDCYEEALNIKSIELGDDSIEVAQILNNIGSVFARNSEYQRALKPWQDAIEIYRNAGLTDEDPKIICTLGNIEISKRFVSPKPTENAIRDILNY